MAALLIGMSCREKTSKTIKEAEKTVEATSPKRYVKDNLLISSALPKIEMQVADEFEYMGSFYFEIKARSEEYPPELRGKPIAAGNRYVFAKADTNKNIEKLFIVQLEGFLPELDYQYNYRFDTAEIMGDNKYRQNTWFYNSALLAEENPENEGALTRAFLKEKGYQMQDDLMMSRWVGLASEDRKNEIIIYYLEMLNSTTGHSLEAYEQLDKEAARAIRDALVDRSRQSFKIVKG